MLTSTAVSAGADDASAWIWRMNKAVAERSYEGVLVHQIGIRREYKRIIHRVQDGRMNERVVVEPSIGPGPGREFVRNGNEWIGYYPERRRVVVQTRNRSYGFLIALNGLNNESARYYNITNVGGVSLDGRAAQHVVLEPRDALRYGYRFWLDPKSALPLKTQRVDRSGKVMEEVFFPGGIALREKITDEQLKPAFDASGFKWQRIDEPIRAPGVTKAFVPRAELLPTGFQVRLFTSPEEEASVGGPRTRFIVSDGIAWVSVFIERPEQAASLGEVTGPRDRVRFGMRPDGVIVDGATATYEVQRDGYKIVVVGEVPPATVKAIAEAVRSD
jgi:sigma-E factor negative regulatory protein RseB